jgi:hypothetical protein
MEYSIKRTVHLHWCLNDILNHQNILHATLLCVLLYADVVSLKQIRCQDFLIFSTDEL